MKKILITDYVHESLITGLEELGFIVNVDYSVNTDSLLQVVKDYYGIVINSKINADKHLIAKGTNLKFIGRLGSGMDIIDLDYAKDRGIKVLSTPEGNRNAVAEHVLGMLLAGLNNIHIADKEVREYKWIREGNRGIEINDKTIGVIGYGNVGSTLVKRLSGFDTEVIVCDPYKKDLFDLPPNARWVDLIELQKKSDFISIHVQLTQETKYFINEAFFNSCKNDLIFINTSRGKNVVLKDLLSAIEAGKIKLACLDVLENEKLNTLTISQKEDFENLIKSQKVILTPHVAGWTQESLKRIAVTLLQKVKEIV